MIQSPDCEIVKLRSCAQEFALVGNSQALLALATG